MNGLSSTALAKITNFAQPRSEAAAVSLTILPVCATASMLIPALVEPILTEAQTKSVSANA